jgi:pimeloyl-ACP methyl ester carboxylesterase
VADGVVLVHGGYHGAWCWDEVRAAMATPTVAVDLPGRGTRPRPEGRVTLADCARAVLDDADTAGFDRFLLVGHSLGGLTITTVAGTAPSRVAGVVYLAALAPAPGQTAFGLLAPELDGADPVGTQAVLPAEVARPMFAGDLDDDRWAAAEARLVPEPVGLFVEGVAGYDPRVPATYVRATRDAVVTPQLVEAMLPNLPAPAVVDIDSDHDVMLSHPAELATLLDRLAEATDR